MRRAAAEQALAWIEVRTGRGRGLYEITSQVAACVGEHRLRTGLLSLHVMHTSASLLVQENADPGVQRDLERFFGELCPDGHPLFEHVQEGPDDMPAHARSALTQSSLALPVRRGSPDLGQWQGIYLWEHRSRPHQRRISLHLLGEFDS